MNKNKRQTVKTSIGTCFGPGSPGCKWLTVIRTNPGGLKAMDKVVNSCHRTKEAAKKRARRGFSNWLFYRLVVAKVKET